jgi:regulator of extracellular matrix RemA (YlzA/DUF370 family)
VICPDCRQGGQHLATAMMTPEGSQRRMALAEAKVAHRICAARQGRDGRKRTICDCAHSVVSSLNMTMIARTGR